MGRNEKGGYGSDSQLNSLISAKKSELAAMKENKMLNAVIQSKAADTITVAGNISPQPNAYLPTPAILPGVVPIAHPDNILDYIRTQTITSPNVVVVNEVSGEGDFDWTAEGALKPKVDFGFATQDEKASKLAAYAKISREMLDDIPFMQAETSRILREKFDRKLSSAVYGGDGTGESIKGITYFAPAYVQTCLNGQVENAGLSEVLFAAATQIRNLGFGSPQVAFVNPCDWAAEMTRKDTLGHLLEINKLLEGITVVPSSEVAPGEFLIGDVSAYTLYIYDNFSTTYGYENDDFTRNLVSIVAEGRVFGFIPDNKLGALVHDSIDSVVSLINKI